MNNHTLRSTRKSGWFTTLGGAALAAPTVLGLRAGRLGLAWLVSAADMAVLVLAWLGIVSDQMPCFLGGVPGCD